MPEHVESVKRISAFLEDRIENGSGTWTQQIQGFIRDLDATAEELVRLYGLTSALPPDLGNVYDLPDELLEELSISKGDELDDQLVTVINACGREASLDQILVGLFRKFGVKQKRRFLQNKLYRMPMIWSVEGKKGVYTTIEPEEATHSAPNIAEAVSTGLGLDDDIPF